MTDPRDLAARIAALSPAQREALLARLAPTARAGAAPIPKRTAADRVPLSYAQQRLWFLHQLEPESPAYNMSTTLPLRGTLDPSALERALTTIVARHEALRTRFVAVGGEPRQVVEAPAPLPLPIVDLSSIPPEARATEAARLVAAEGVKPFDLATGPVVRALLVRLTASEHVLTITMHHIVSDGWSRGVLNAELTTLYAAFVDGRPSPLPPLDIQYADFSEWQRRTLQGDELERQLGYWRQQLDDVPLLDLATDRRRPPTPTYAGAAVVARLERPVVDRLKRFGEAEKTTTAIILLAAFKALMQRYTGQTDIVVGSPIANRNRRELEGLIGFFVNSLVMRTDLGGDPSFATVVERVRQTALAAYEHQDLPFEQLVQTLQPRRDPSRHPLFQVMFAVQNAPAAEAALRGLTIEAGELDSSVTRFDLECHVLEQAGELRIALCYSTDLFLATTARRLLDHYVVLIEDALTHPDRPLSQLALLTPDDEAREAATDAAAAPYPADRSIRDLFEARVAERPEAPALIEGSRILSYRELDVRAGALARRLRNLGVTVDTPVGICLPRGADLIVAVVAAIKAGGSYVAIDPDYPTSRMRYLLEDTGTPVVVTVRTFADRLPPWPGTALCLDEPLPEAPPPERAADPGPLSLALIIYTSGSTGRPKGVCLTQRGVVRLVVGTNYITFTPADRVAQAASLTFDASTLEIWGALLNGATLVIIPKDIALAPAALTATLARHEVSVLFLTTALFNQMAESAIGMFGRLRWVMFGGEAADPEAVRRVLREGRPGRLVHLYGPAESTTLATWYPVDDVPERAVTVPIGRPVTNTSVFVLDAALRPVPTGVPGELHVGGDGLARGYLNHAELTAERFVEDPVRGRLYRTGDIVRRRDDGALEFVGRRDFQVKIRGYRIELGEIETTMTTHPGVAESVVIARDQANGERQLVAYLVPRDEDGADDTGTRADWENERVDTWRALYDETYSASATDTDPTFNITGWNSSYTGEPIPPAEMREWVDTTVARIEALAPRRVLEIGCGTGLLLYRIAPSVERYHALDFSAAALGRIAVEIAKRPDLARVTLSRRMADDLAEVAPRSVDTVIINSVSQYFPSVEYLARVLEQAADRVAPGGHLFVGDVRHFGFLVAYHGSVQCARAASTATATELAERVRQHALNEEELLIDPAFFEALRARIPRITDVQVSVKRGAAANELTRFRYDVTMAIDGPTTGTPTTWWRWGVDVQSEADLIARLRARTGPVGISGVPDARLATEARLLDWLREPPAGATVGDFRNDPDRDAVDLEGLWRELEAGGHTVAIGYAATGEVGRVDVVVSPPGSGVQPGLPTRATAPRPWTTFGTNPLRAKAGSKLIPAVRAFLKERLPEYMVPGAFVLLDRLPLTANGKVDRRALPAPAGFRQLSAGYVAPKGATEERLAAIWSEVLEVGSIGGHDDFFDLGGHSLLATQVVSRVRDQFGVEVPVRLMFENPTVAGLARVVEAASPARKESAIPRRARQGRPAS
ncbi:MAG: amino acid adenylation domain-containing protein [Gemmatimonadetes bacterium]|nr:amino acid adenylation domain-containing protein [Gemmatimonadota bacterium]